MMPEVLKILVADFLNRKRKENFQYLLLQRYHTEFDCYQDDFVNYDLAMDCPVSGGVYLSERYS